MSDGGPLGAYRIHPATDGRAFENVHPSGNIRGMGVEASVGANTTWELGFRPAPTIAAVGKPYLCLSMLADQATSDTAKYAQVQVKWKSTSLGTTKASLSSLVDDWTDSPTTAGEYYYNGTPPAEPNVVYRDGMPIKWGTLGSLAAGECAWGDQDTLGADTLYVKEPTDVDPDTSSSGIHIEVVSAGEAVSGTLNDEGAFTVVHRGYADDDDWITVYIPLDADTIIGGEEIDMELIFLTTGWTLDAVSTWLAEIVWLQET